MLTTIEDAFRGHWIRGIRKVNVSRPLYGRRKLPLCGAERRSKV